MAHESSLKDTGSSQVNCDISDSTYEIKIKTLGLETHSFRVRKNMPISALKREIMNKIDFPVEEQRLLYRGQLVRDDQLMSELNLGDGDTMHLVKMRPVQFQPTISTITGNTSRTSRRQGTPAARSLNTSRIRSGNLANSCRDTLTTISDFINRMKGEFEVCSNSLNNDQLQMNATPDSPDAGTLLPAPVFLSQVLHRTELLLRDSATTAISHLSTSLLSIDSSPDQVLRGRIQFGALQLGLAMQHLGAMLLELGQTTMSLVIGQSPGESYVNAGHAVYLSPTGPNPIMIQQYPFESWYPYGPHFPVHYREEQAAPVRSDSQGSGSTSTRPPSGSNSAQSLPTQATACIPNVFSCNDNAQVQNSSNATRGFHAVVSSGTQSDMSGSTLQTPELINCVLQATQMTLNELFNPEVEFLDRGNDGVRGDSENVGAAEEGVKSGSGENNVSDLSVSREVEQLVDLGQAVERIEQINIRRNIFGEALSSVIDQYGEADVYVDTLELGGVEFADEVMEAYAYYFHR